MSEPARMQIQLNADHVVGPAHKALAICAHLMPHCVQAARTADLDNPPKLEGGFFEVRIEQTEPLEQRRAFFEHWLVAKAFHEMARGVRLSLEEAAVYLWAFDLNGKSMTYGDFLAEQEAVRKRANSLNFPDLIKEIGGRLATPFEFEEAYSSLNKARNVLEHQDGVVLPRHLDPGGEMMSLLLPEQQIWAADLDPPQQITGPMKLEEGALIELRVGFHKKEYRAGERVGFSGEELYKIASGCVVFVQDLAGKLPR